MRAKKTPDRHAPTKIPLKKPRGLKPLPVQKPKPPSSQTKKKKSPLASRRRQVIAKTKLAPSEVQQQITNEERMALVGQAAIRKHALEGKPYRVIAEELWQEFKLEVCPSLTAVCRWIASAKEVLLHEISDLQIQLRMEQLNELEELKRPWWEAATRNLLVRRTVMRDGRAIEEVDEDAFKEHEKAANVVIKLMERQARLLGLDLAGSDDNKGKATNIQEIYMFISQQLNSAPIKLADGREVETFGGLELSLDSGIDENEVINTL